MKLVKLSLATILGLGTVSLSANTLADALSSGKVHGKATIWYQTKDAGNKDLFDSPASIGDAGLELGYVSNSWNGLGFGATFYALDALNLDLYHFDIVSGTPHGALGVLKTDTWLGEAYATYKAGNTLFKIGRQNLKTPLANSDGWAVHPNNFEAVVAINTDLPNTTLIGAYVTKERTRTSGSFEDFMGWTGTDTDGAIMLAAINKSVANMPLQLFYYNVDEVAQAIYAQADYKIAGVSLAGQYVTMIPQGQLEDALGDDTTQAFGAKATMSMAGVKVCGAASYVSDGTLRVANTGDSMTKTPIFTKTITGDGDIAGATDTLGTKLSASMEVMPKLSLSGTWGYYWHDEKSSALKSGLKDDESLALEAVAKYSGLENLTLFASYMFTDEATGAYSDNGEDVNTVRFWARYAF